jgi:hypothetical protein
LVGIQLPKLQKSTNMVMLVKNFPIFLLVLFLAGCVTTPDRDFNHLQVMPGMAKEALLEEFGPPRSEESVLMPGQKTPTQVMRYVASIDMGNGDRLEKDLTIFLSDGLVVNKRYIERRVLKTQKGSRPSNNIIQLN